GCRRETTGLAARTFLCGRRPAGGSTCPNEPCLWTRSHTFVAVAMSRGGSSRGQSSGTACNGRVRSGRALLDLADDLFGFVASEGAQRFRVLGAVALQLHDDLGRGLVVGCLEDLDHVVAAERDVDADEGSARLRNRALPVLDALAPRRQAGDALGRPAHQRHVVGHELDDDGRGVSAVLLLTREPRRPDLLPEATVAAKVTRVGNAFVTQARIRACG